LCRGWSQEKRRLRSELAAGCYRFGLLSRVTLKGGEVDRHLAAPRRLGAKGALAGVGTVLWILDQMLLGKGHGESKRAVRSVWAHLTTNRFLPRTDVKDFYAPSITMFCSTGCALQDLRCLSRPTLQSRVTPR